MRVRFATLPRPPQFVGEEFHMYLMYVDACNYERIAVMPVQGYTGAIYESVGCGRPMVSREDVPAAVDIAVRAAYAAGWRPHLVERTA